MMPSNKQFTNWDTQSVMEIRNPHFYARPLQAQAVQKDWASYFLVNRLVNRYYKLITVRK